MGKESGSVRIVIAGPPKTGNVWLKCLLASVYDLRPLGPKLAPDRPSLESFTAWVGQGRFRDGTIFHQHYEYSPELAAAIAAVPAHVVTIVRDPYDAFVSTYFTLQNHLDDENRRSAGRHLLMGKPLDHPDVLAYLREDGYRSHLTMANDWLHSGRSLVVRYEDLHRDPEGTLAGLASRIAPVVPERLRQAIDACSADPLRTKGGARAKHVRSATVGDSKQRLGEPHLAIFRDRYADLVRSLGYEVR